MTKIDLGLQYDDTIETAAVAAVRQYVVVDIQTTNPDEPGWVLTTTPNRARALADALIVAAEQAELVNDRPTLDEVYAAVDAEDV